MKIKSLAIRSLLNALLAFAYIFCIGSIVRFAPKKIFENAPGIFGPVVILTLLVISAAMMGILIFGKPVLLYFENQKKEGVVLLGYTIGWLALILLITILFLIII